MLRKNGGLSMNLNLQKSMKAEMEVAMKLLEKDVHEKQDTIRALRDQLEDIKSINLDMYTKLQVRTSIYIVWKFWSKKEK